MNTATKQTVIVFGLMVTLVAGAIGAMAWTTAKDKDSGSTAAPPSNEQAAVNPVDNTTGFVGDEGETVQSDGGGQILIEESKVQNGNLHTFNYYSPTANKTIYFFIVKASDGTYRAAANACEVCFKSKKGFTQVSGGGIRCENCRTMYTKDQIALQKGGCNPRPIDKDVQATDGRLAINVTDIESSADLF